MYENKKYANIPLIPINSHLHPTCFHSFPFCLLYFASMDGACYPSSVPKLRDVSSIRCHSTKDHVHDLGTWGALYIAGISSCLAD